MSDIIDFTLIIVVAGFIVAAAIGTLVVIGTWFSPRLRNMGKGIKPVKGHLECCPPGLGCNETDKNYRKCLRTEARKIAKVDELMALDQSWSIYQGTPYRKKKAKAETLAEYNKVRDGIIARALNDMAEKLNESRALQLPAHIDHSGRVKGTVV